MDMGETVKSILGNKTVLVAEDNRINAMVFTSFFEAWGANVVVVDNGEMAVQKALEINPDLVLMDVHMPVMDGIQAMGAIRKELPWVPIIAVSASLAYDEKNRSLQAGANEFILKPINSAKLQHAITASMK